MIKFFLLCLKFATTTATEQFSDILRFSRSFSSVLKKTIKSKNTPSVFRKKKPESV